ncbi:MAG: stage V sporulation protein AD, partial [Clostridia bacterium]|nr:stage V sporulation protein AD [Clostridia bacterium]
SDFDRIVTGDLGHIGSDILYKYLAREYHLDIQSLHDDCGKLIFAREA